jgi:hypothetical protein
MHASLVESCVGLVYVSPQITPATWMTFAYLLHRLPTDWFFGKEWTDARGMRRLKWEYDAAGSKETETWTEIKPMRRAFRTLMKARAALNRDDVQLVAQDVRLEHLDDDDDDDEDDGAKGKAKMSKKFTLCLWRPLYQHLCRLAPGTRHMYAIVMERHNRHGIPLVMDLDIPASARMTRAEFIALLRRIVDTIGAPCLVYDACSADGQKMSAHIVCRRVAFRTSEAGRKYAVWMYQQVRDWIASGTLAFMGDTTEMWKWVDDGIPKLNGQFKLPGNTKAEVGKRAQRPNHGLVLDLAPLRGDERYEDILSWEEFDANRTWLYAEEVAAVLHWPMAATVPIPSVFAITLTQMTAHYSAWNFGTLTARYGTLFPCYLEYGHVECIQREGPVLSVDREGDPLLTLRVRPDPARWVVFDIHEKACAGHSRHDTCRTCWAKNQARMFALLNQLGDQALQLTVYYTGGNGVHAWLELRNEVERFAFAAPNARRLLGAMENGKLVRVPGALHERTGRASYSLPRSMDVPGLHSF